MHRIGHHITGALTGLGVGMHLSSQDGAGFSVLGISVLGGWYGGVFPDAFEKIWGMYWIQHRTVTHWVPLWLAALIAVLTMTSPLPFGLGPEIFAALLAFVLGGLTHLLFDWPNPTGIPFIHPWCRHSLNWWRSGEADLLCVLVWGAAMVGFGTTA